MVQPPALIPALTLTALPRPDPWSCFGIQQLNILPLQIFHLPADSHYQTILIATFSHVDYAYAYAIIENIGILG